MEGEYLETKTKERTAMHLGGAAMQFSHHVKELSDVFMQLTLAIGCTRVI